MQKMIAKEGDCLIGWRRLIRAGCGGGNTVGPEKSATGPVGAKLPWGSAVEL